jgi:asparagine synthase (glutamine-hydrolysing)
MLIGYLFSKTLNTDKPQLLKLKGGTMAFDGRIYSPKNFADTLATTTTPNHDNKRKLEKLLKKTDGDFALVLVEPERILTCRSSIGCRPLYQGQNSVFVAIASERKALLKIGIKETCSFPPGYIATADKRGFKFIPTKILKCAESKQMTMKTAARKLQTLLEDSVKKRTSDLKEVAVAFSGGLDSSIIARLAKKSNINVHLVHVSLRNQPETEHAKKAAEELKLPISIHIYEEEDLEKVIPKVLWQIEEPDPIKTSIGIPLYWTAENAAKKGFRVLLAGQGADEMFGGYKRYVDEYFQHGDTAAQRRMLEDTAGIHESNIERDFKICNFHTIELRLPFATYKIAKFAISLPIELKFERSQNTLRKLVLRNTAKNLGIPENIVEKPKKAIQYTTGINKALEKICRKKKIAVKEYLQVVFQNTAKRMA